MALLKDVSLGLSARKVARWRAKVKAAQPGTRRVACDDKDTVEPLRVRVHLEVLRAEVVARHIVPARDKGELLVLQD